MKASFDLQFCFGSSKFGQPLLRRLKLRVQLSVVHAPHTGRAEGYWSHALAGAVLRVYATKQKKKSEIKIKHVTKPQNHETAKDAYSS